MAKDTKPTPKKSIKTRAVSKPLNMSDKTGPRAKKLQSAKSRAKRNKPLVNPALESAIAPAAIAPFADEPITASSSDTPVSHAKTAPEVSLPDEEELAKVGEPQTVAEVPSVKKPPASVASQTVAESAPQRQAGRWLRGRRLILTGVALLLLAGGLFWYKQAHSDTNGVIAKNKALVAEVAQRAILPTGETPSVTTVVDKSKLSQSFLASAANGDKVLLYFQAGKAIVYRPSTHQIVNEGPLTSPPAKIFLRGGTAATIPSSLSDKLANPSAYSIVSQDSSPRQDYSHTLVVDIAGNRPDIAAKVAKAIGAQVSVLPPGETAPAADILIIVGADAN